MEKIRVAGWTLAVVSALLTAAPVWVWRQGGEGGWELALAAAFLIAGGMLTHGLITLGVCITVAWVGRTYLLAVTGIALTTAACAGILYTVNRDYRLAAVLTAIWAGLGILAGVWLAGRRPARSA